MGFIPAADAEAPAEKNLSPEEERRRYLKEVAINAGCIAAWIVLTTVMVFYNKVSRRGRRRRAQGGFEDVF